MSLEHMLKVHTKAIGVLSISTDGCMLLSGGNLYALVVIQFSFFDR